MTNAKAVKVPPDKDAAWKYLATAKRMLGDASVPGLSPEAQFTLLYDAARNAVVAALRVDGVKITSGSRSHMVTLAEASRILGEEHAATLDRINTVRHARHQIEYDNREVSEDEVSAAFEPARAIVELVEELLFSSVE